MLYNAPEGHNSLNKCKDISCFWIGRCTVVKMSVLTNHSHIQWFQFLKHAERIAFGTRWADSKVHVKKISMQE